MALQKPIVLENDMTCAESFHRVTDIDHYRNRESCIMHMEVYKDSTAYNAGKIPVLTFPIECTDSSAFDTFFSISAISPDNSNLYSQSYVYAKTLTDAGGQFDYTTDTTDVLSY